MYILNTQSSENKTYESKREAYQQARNNPWNDQPQQGRQK